MDGLKGRRKRGGITAPSMRMEPLAMPRVTPQQGGSYATPKPVSPEAHIRSYKRRGIGARRGGGPKPHSGY